MRVVASTAILAAMSLSFGTTPAAACYGCQGTYYPTGGPVISAPPVIQSAPVYQAPVVHAAPVYQAPVVAAPVYQAPIYQAPVVQAAPVYQAPVVIDGGYNSRSFGHRGHGYSDGGHYGPRGRTVFYERGDEYLVSRREYFPYNGYGGSNFGGSHYGGSNYGTSHYGGGSYYAEPSYYAPHYRPYYRPYRRAEICFGGAYVTGQAFCGMRP